MKQMSATFAKTLLGPNLATYLQDIKKSAYKGLVRRSQLSCVIRSKKWLYM